MNLAAHAIIVYHAKTVPAIEVLSFRLQASKGRTQLSLNLCSDF